MRKRELTRLALLGLASGCMALCSGVVEAEEASFDAQQMMAKKGCKGEGGCAGLTASNDKHADADEELDEETDDKAATVPKVKKDSK
jgi:hypothetical protein